jgi:hypothetical protein
MVAAVCALYLFKPNWVWLGIATRFWPQQLRCKFISTFVTVSVFHHKMRDTQITCNAKGVEYTVKHS